MRWRLIATFVLVTLVLLLSHDIPLASYLRRTTTERLLAEMERDAFIIGGASEDVLSASGESDNLDVGASIRAYAGQSGAHVVVTNGEGAVVATTEADRPAGTSYTNRPEITLALTGQPQSGRRFSATLGGDLVYVAVPVLSGAHVVGVVRISYPAAIIDKRVGTRTRGLFIVAAITLAAAAVSALTLSASITRPLTRLRTATRRLATGDFTARADTTEGAPEFRELAAAFNDMTTRIEGLVRQQQAFASDASHQLRTPLTALTLQLEHAANFATTDPTESLARIDASRSEVDRLQHLVNGLLLLARAEHRTEPLVEIDIAAMGRERADLWAPLAEEMGVTIRTSTPSGGPVTAVASAGTPEQILDNLLDNALRVSPSGSTLDLHVTNDDETASIHVLDRGPGMTDEQIERSFDRFWRASTSTGGGSGLGLPIASHLARADGGGIHLSRRPGGGLDACYVVNRRPHDLGRNNIT